MYLKFFVFFALSFSKFIQFNYSSIASTQFQILKKVLEIQLDIICFSNFFTFFEFHDCSLKFFLPLWSYLTCWSTGLRIPERLLFHLSFWQVIVFFLTNTSFCKVNWIFFFPFVKSFYIDSFTENRTPK